MSQTLATDSGLVVDSSASVAQTVFAETLLAQATTQGALVVFLIYSVVVFLIAIAADRFGRKNSFLGEFFLGSRSLGVWAFALTYAATSASGGSFLGFPSLVYTHGWSVGLWIGGYMIVPLVSMGLLAKRMNQVARKTGAITVPDVLRDRFGSASFGTVCTLLIVLFLSINLIGQFKAGAQIIETLLAGQPLYELARTWIASTLGDGLGLGIAAREPGYVLSLLAFALIVLFYTAYGGFRAVVWTDVLQGLIMVIGVVLLLPMTIWAVGGLSAAHEKIALMTPPLNTHVVIERSLGDSEATPSDGDIEIPKGSWIIQGSIEEGNKRVFRTKSRSVLRADQPRAQWNAQATGEPTKAQHIDWLIPVIEITTLHEIESLTQHDLSPNLAARGATPQDYIDAKVEAHDPRYAYGHGEVGTYTLLPGPDPNKAAGFLSIGLALSFFLMWNFSGSGQPGNMVRLLAFKDSRTLQRAMFTMAIYYSVIYFPLVIIFVLARVLLPGWEIESDRIMPEMASHVTKLAGIPWLAGLLLAAPFAAVMSTMDSFLLVNASAIARDIYHRNLAPKASEARLKAVSVGSTVIIGVVTMVMALDPPKYLQDLVVYTTSGMSTCFLAPVFLALYWRRFNLAGAFGSLIGGLLTYNVLYFVGSYQNGFERMTPLEPGGFHPFLIGAAASFVAGVAVSLATAAPSREMTEKFFGAPETSPATETKGETP